MWTRLQLLAALAMMGRGQHRAAATITPTTEPNMNGEYLLSPTPKAPKSTWSTSFKDYPGGVESFTLYAGPITSTYSEVFWTALPEVKLPEDIIRRFQGKGMAVVGFEVDQVRKGAGANGEDVSVPINVAYNHHYAASLLGEGSHMERVRYDPKDPRTTLLTPEPGWDFISVEHAPSPNGLPTSVWAGYSNGGEYRKTYHGLAPPYAQVLESPRALSFQPMQVTRECARPRVTSRALISFALISFALISSARPRRSTHGTGTR